MEEIECKCEEWNQSLKDAISTKMFEKVTLSEDLGDFRGTLPMAKEGNVQSITTSSRHCTGSENDSENVIVRSERKWETRIFVATQAIEHSFESAQGKICEAFESSADVLQETPTDFEKAECILHQTSQPCQEGESNDGQSNEPRRQSLKSPDSNLHRNLSSSTFKEHAISTKTLTCKHSSASFPASYSREGRATVSSYNHEGSVTASSSNREGSVTASRSEQVEPLRPAKGTKFELGGTRSLLIFSAEQKEKLCAPYFRDGPRLTSSPRVFPEQPPSESDGKKNDTSLYDLMLLNDSLSGPNSIYFCSEVCSKDRSELQDNPGLEPCSNLPSEQIYSLYGDDFPQTELQQDFVNSVSMSEAEFINSTQETASLYSLGNQRIQIWEREELRETIFEKFNPFCFRKNKTPCVEMSETESEISCIRGRNEDEYERCFPMPPPHIIKKNKCHYDPPIILEEDDLIETPSFPSASLKAEREPLKSKASRVERMPQTFKRKDSKNKDKETQKTAMPNLCQFAKEKIGTLLNCRLEGVTDAGEYARRLIKMILEKNLAKDRRPKKGGPKCPTKVCHSRRNIPNEVKTSSRTAFHSSTKETNSLINDLSDEAKETIRQWMKEDKQPCQHTTYSKVRKPGDIMNPLPFRGVGID